MNWWNDVPLAVERPRPQATVTLDDYQAARSRVTQPRDAVIVELLWCTGMRRSEIARAQVEHLDLAIGILTIPVSKTGKFRTVPLYSVDRPEFVIVLKQFPYFLFLYTCLFLFP